MLIYQTLLTPFSQASKRSDFTLDVSWLRDSSVPRMTLFYPKNMSQPHLRKQTNKAAGPDGICGHTALLCRAVQ